MDQIDEAVTGQGTLVQVLGPVTATVRGRPCLISSPMQRAVLSLLAVDAGRVVTQQRRANHLVRSIRGYQLDGDVAYAGIWEA